MTPAARVQAAIEAIDAWQAGDDGLDRVLARWGRAHRFAGSSDRHAIANLVYDTVRRLRSAAWIAGAAEPATGRDLMRGSLMLAGVDPAPLFSGARHAPVPLADDECAPARSLGGAPRPVRLDYPDWLQPDLAAVADDVLAAMAARAPLDLRVNLLKTTKAEARSALAAEGIETEDAPLAATALRVRAGARGLQRGGAFRGGLVDVQDAASQAVAELAAARPGETVLDLCAGGGGKSLAMAAAMRNEGRLLAHDIAPERLAQLPPRAARAGARVRLAAAADLGALGGACDLVLVDAPCSGSGTWRRNPDAKWRLDRDALDRLLATQAALVDRAAGLVRPGGRLVYATCSLLAAEGERQIERFLAEAPGWEIAATRRHNPPAGDGFFAADLRRPSPQHGD